MAINNQIKLKHSEINKIESTIVPFDNIEYELLYNIDFDKNTLSDELMEQLHKEIINELSNSKKYLYH